MSYSSVYVFRQCSRQECQFRFPAESANQRAEICPKCGAETGVVENVSPQPPFPMPPGSHPAGIFEALLDNIRSIFNVGTIFRSAEGAGFRGLHLCGITPTPDHPKLAKTALGAESCLSWTYAPNALTVARQLKESGAVLWALECTPDADPFFSILAEKTVKPIVLIVGNEVVGVDPGLIALCDRVAWLPMQGRKESLNVAVGVHRQLHPYRTVRQKLFRSFTHFTH
jgi:23S rRNA (guanosine2251-2'-O)-methyltransferase